MKKLFYPLMTFFAVMPYSSLLSQKNKIFTVKANQVTTAIESTMWGIFFEDINLGADGGLYAELVKNRSFEFSTPMMGWREQRRDGGSGSFLLVNRGLANGSNPRYLRIAVTSATGNFGLANEGFRGIGIKANNQYNFSVLARQQEGSSLSIQIELVSPSGQKLGTTILTPTGKEWKKYEVSFNASATEPKARLNVWFLGVGSMDIDMISLFPKDTWKQRPGGLRADLVQLLAEIKPGFLRFPGGCIVEGRDLASRYQWKKTVGNVDARENIINRWNTEFRHRPTPDYFQSFGLGFFEYFQLSEDIGAEPLPIINCGMACQFNTGEVVPMENIQVFIQDALDLIEFANGDVQTQWGRLRSQMGHPAPFNMKFLGIGNEQWGPQYIERYKVFAKAIKDKYPRMKLVNSVGTDPDGERFDFLDSSLRKLNADILDEHYYRAPDWFLKNAGRYDNYDRNGPKIFAGEYAAQSVGIASPDNKNNWRCALAEAAFMTGLERNAAVVHMASYAPLFAHADGWQWTPDLIWFDNLNAYATPNYYVQKLFSINKGTHVVPLLDENKPVSGQDSCYASAIIDRNLNELILKIVNSSSKEMQRDIVIDGVKKLNATAQVTVLKSENLNEINTLNNPENVKPSDEQVQFKGKKLSLSLPPYSFHVIRVKML